MSSIISLTDVARAAGVSKSTASRVVTGKAAGLRIPKATRDRVMTAVRQLGYRPGSSPRSAVYAAKPSQISNSKSQIQERQIGVVLSADSPASSLALIPDLVPAMAAADYRLVIVTLPAEAVAANQRINRLLKEGTAGLLCCPSLYLAVTTAVGTQCPIIVLWQGSAKAMLEKLGVGKAAVPPPPAPIITPAPSARSPTPVVAPTPIPPRVASPAPVPVPRPVVPLVNVATPAAMPEPAPAVVPNVTPDPVVVETPMPTVTVAHEEPGSVELRPPVAVAPEVEPAVTPVIVEIAVVSSEPTHEVMAPAATVTEPVPAVVPIVTPDPVVVETPTPTVTVAQEVPGSVELRPPVAVAPEVEPAVTPVIVEAPVTESDASNSPEPPEETT